ncbi:hypothetical protein [Putridiphycobacter roseus]|nr:hypothetical protein [Putridiphycobacter roseus]
MNRLILILTLVCVACNTEYDKESEVVKTVPSLDFIAAKVFKSGF